MLFPANDSDLLLPVLAILWRHGTISTKLYRAFLYAAERDVLIPITVGDMRQALGEPGTPQLFLIPRLGKDGIAHLHILFLEMDQDMT